MRFTGNCVRAMAILTALAFSQSVPAQTGQFTYQGSINNAGVPANGSFDFEFVLFDALNAGSQIGSVATRSGIVVANSMFSVQLSFPTAFPGASRFLEIRVRPSGQPTFTTLTPRQSIDSAPYSIKSLNADTATNATQLGGVAANQYVVTTDPRMTDARTPVAGSGDYIQNRNTQQALTNFNISGNGTVGGTLAGNVVDVATQYNIGGARVFRVPGSGNTYIGVLAGDGHTTGNSNTFVGFRPGRLNSTGSSNSFFGTAAGFDNTTGGSNSFFGSSAGASNTTSSENSFFGAFAGSDNTGNDNSFFGFRSGNANTTGGGNSFFGHRSGNSNTTGLTNSFFGYTAGEANTIGQNNAFFGANAGAANTTALGNSFFGANAGAANTTGMGNSFFGASSGMANTSINNSFFGTVTGVANTTGASNSFFGHWAGHDNVSGSSNAYLGAFAGEANTTGDFNSFIGRSSGEFTTGSGNTFVGYDTGRGNVAGSNNTLLGSNADLGFPGLTYATAIGAEAVATQSSTIVLGRSSGSDRVIIHGVVQLLNVPLGNGTPLCTVGGLVAACASSLRYKTNVEDFSSGLEIVRRLRPIAYTWRSDGSSDVGFAAEEVHAIEPRLITRNVRGEIESVKYGQLTTVLVNAVKEQQAEIDELRRQVEELKSLLCLQNASASLCKAPMSTETIGVKR